MLIFPKHVSKADTIYNNKNETYVLFFTDNTGQKNKSPLFYQYLSQIILLYTPSGY